MIAKAAELEVVEEQLIETDQSANGIELSLGDLDMVAGGGVVDVFLLAIKNCWPTPVSLELARGRKKSASLRAVCVRIEGSLQLAPRSPASQQKRAPKRPFCPTTA